METDPTAEEVKALQGCINNLISVLALPAIWTGQGSSRIVTTLLDALLGMLRLDFAGARVSESIAASAMEIVRSAQRRELATRPQEVEAAFSRLLTGASPTSPRRVTNPIGEGEVSIAVYRLGIQDELATLVVGSRRPDFPTPFEMLVLRVAANQATIGLREARLISERKRAEEVLEQQVAERTREITAVNEELRTEIAEHQRAEAKLRDSERRFRLLADAIPHQVWSYLPGGAIDYCNQRWLEYTGVTLDEVQGDGWARCLHPDEAESVLKAWRAAWAEGKPYEAEQRMRGSDGRYRRFDSRAVPVYDEGGRLIQWFGTNTDVEERRQMSEALQTAQAELAHVTRLTTVGELAASLAHELNQPLAAVIANGSACLRWLDRDPPNLAEATAAGQRIIRDANRASEVIAETRAFLKKSGGDKTPLDIAEVVREVLVLVRPEAVKQRTALQELHVPELPAILGARVQLQQVVLNLIMNGIEAMTDVAERPRELLVRSELYQLQDGPGVLVAVHDAGTGLTADRLERVFEPFYTTKAQGLGMGLPISRSIIQAHGGRLWATPNPGHGMTFQFVLPAWSKPEA